MMPAARVGDTTGHAGTITGPGVATVLIGGMPAAVLGDSHACGLFHGPSVIVRGSATVMIGKRPAARVSDTVSCGAPIVTGMMTVLVGG